MRPVFVGSEIRYGIVILWLEDQVVIAIVREPEWLEDLLVMLTVALL